MVQTTAIIRNYIKHFEFERLFNELGWDHFRGDIPAKVGPSGFTVGPGLDRRSKKQQRKTGNRRVLFCAAILLLLYFQSRLTWYDISNQESWVHKKTASWWNAKPSNKAHAG